MDLAFASDNAADTVGLFASSGQSGLYGLSSSRINNQHHTETHVEGLQRLRLRKIRLLAGKRTTGGMGQVPKSTSAFTPAGKARFRFSVMPPPVM